MILIKDSKLRNLYVNFKVVKNSKYLEMMRFKCHKIMYYEMFTSLRAEAEHRIDDKKFLVQ